MPRLFGSRCLLAPFTAMHAVAPPDAFAGSAGATGGPRPPPVPRAATTYRVETSEKFDALCLINLLSDDPFYVKYYPVEHAWWRERVSAETLAAARRIKQVLKDEGGGIVSASLVLYFSASRSATVAGALGDLEHIDALRRRFERTPYYDAEEWARLVSIAPELRTVLRGLRAARFPQYWASALKARLEERAALFRPALASRDIVPLQEKMLGFRLKDRSITVYLVHFARPHGIKVTGNRFLTEAELPPEIVLRTAIHEMMHPPFDTADPALWAAVEPIRAHALVVDRLAHHDPSFGYNTFEGLLEEGVVKTLDQFIAERLGIAVPAEERWRKNDQGLHVIAAALYQVMREDRYDETGGNAAGYLRDPEHVRRTAAALDRIAANGL
jgi:hypothetical protein